MSVYSPSSSPFFRYSFRTPLFLYLLLLSSSTSCSSISFSFFQWNKVTTCSPFCPQMLFHKREEEEEDWGSLILAWVSPRQIDWGSPGLNKLFLGRRSEVLKINPDPEEKQPAELWRKGGCQAPWERLRTGWDISLIPSFSLCHTLLQFSLKLPIPHNPSGLQVHRGGLGSFFFTFSDTQHQCIHLQKPQEREDAMPAWAMPGPCSFLELGQKSWMLALMWNVLRC